MPPAAAPELSAPPAPVPPPPDAEALAGPAPGRLVALLLVAAFLPRALLFFLNENLYGDAVVRTELAERWLRAPRWIGAYGEGAYQFGPLHIYLGGAALKLLPWREHALRGVSLVLGTLSVVPLFHLTRRAFGWRAGVWAGLAFAVWGMHLQLSTTAASEAVALFFVLACVASLAHALEENRFGPLVVGALALNLACATRYDAWLLVPLLALLLALHGSDRVAALTRSLSFGLLCLPFPLLWMQGNEVAHGDALYPVRVIEAFHAAWVADGVARYGEVAYRLQNLFFWPGAALVTLSPAVGALGMLGLWRAWRTRPHLRWLVWTALAPALYYTVRGALLLDFVPLARFTVVQLALLLPFAPLGFDWLVQRWPPRAARGLAGVSVALALAFPLGLGVYTFRNDASLARSLRPVSPTSTNPVALMEVARFLREEVAAQGGAAVLDDEPGYLDLQLAFYSGLPEMRLARVRWDTFRRRLADAQPGWVVRFEGGSLVRQEGVRLEGHTLVLDGVVYEELPGFSPPLHVYRRRQGP